MLKIGDWVRITNANYKGWVGKTGFVTSLTTNSESVMIFVEVGDPERMTLTVWTSEHLEYLGTAEDHAKAVLGDDYFHG